jgi:3-hydroxyisobutyrate dehydrogenase-like beta-hydroxyacid dehydrogenase
VFSPGVRSMSPRARSARRVAEEHVRHRQDYVAGPVLGNPDFARERKLFVLAGGARSAVEKVRPLLERLGQRLFVIGKDTASANLMKLAANALTATTLECMGEVLALLRKGATDFELTSFADDVVLLTHRSVRRFTDSGQEQHSLRSSI